MGIDWRRFYEPALCALREPDPACSRTFPLRRARARSCWPRGRPRSPTSSCIALLLRTGLPGVGVLQLAQNLLDAFGGLAGLLRAGPDELKRIKGLGGKAKRAEVAAVLELARRSVASELSARPVFDSPGKVKDYLALQLGARRHEVFAVLFLDAQSRLHRPRGDVSRHA